MIAFNDYRKKKLQKIINSNNFAEAFDAQFDLMKLEIMDTFKSPKVLTESIQDRFDAVLLKLVYLEDYEIGNHIVSHYTEEAKKYVSTIVENAAADLDAGAHINSVRDEIKKAISRVFERIKQQITKSVQDSRQSAPGPSVQPEEPSVATPTSGGKGGLFGQANQKSPFAPRSQQSSANPQTTPQFSAPSATQDNRISVPNRKGWYGWLKDMFSPTSWKNWANSREGMRKVRDLMAHDPAVANMINKKWNQKFKYESVSNVQKQWLEFTDVQVSSLMATIDQFGKNLAQFIDDKIAKYNATRAITPTQTRREKPQIQPTVKNSVVQDEPNVIQDMPQVEPEPTKEPESTGIGQDEVQSFLNALNSKPRKAKVESKYYTRGRLALMKETEAGRTDLFSLAKALGFKDLPSRKNGIDNWNDIETFVGDNMERLGYLGSGERPKKSTGVQKARPKPGTPEKAPVSAGVDDDWENGEIDAYDSSVTNDTAQKAYDELIKIEPDSDKIIQLMNHYWRKHKLDQWEPQSIQDMKSILQNRKKNSEPETKEEPVSEPEAKVEEPEIKQEPVSEPEPSSEEPVSEPEPKEEPKKEEKPTSSDGGTPVSERAQVVELLSDQLKTHYRPSINEEHVRKFVSKFNVIPFLKKNDLQGIVDALSEFQGIKFQRITRKDPEDRDPEDEPLSKGYQSDDDWEKSYNNDDIAADDDDIANYRNRR